MADRYGITYAPVVREHLDALERRHWSMIRSSIAMRLAYEPIKTSRNRKRMGRPNELGAPWELRFGPNNRFRAFYDVDEEARMVEILAIGVKRGNRLRIGGRELDL